MEDSALLPVKNKFALIGYYLGVASFIPFIGLPTSIAALVLGILGLKEEKKQLVPGARGHAITAVVLGSVLGFIHIVVVAVVIVSAAMSSSS